MTPSHELPELWVRNGSVYLTRTEVLRSGADPGSRRPARVRHAARAILRHRHPARPRAGPLAASERPLAWSRPMRIGTSEPRRGTRPARHRGDRQQPRRQHPPGRGAHPGGRRRRRRRRQVPDPHRRGRDAGVDADAAALRRAALHVHAADGALARRARPPQGLRRRARADLVLDAVLGRRRRTAGGHRHPLYKVASGEVTNPPLLDAIAATGKPVHRLERHVGAGGCRACRGRSSRAPAPTSW